MKRILFGSFCIFLFTLTSEANSRVIYGDDNRKDIYDVADPTYLRLAASTLGLFRSSSVTEDTKHGTAALSLASYATRHNLCSTEPFYDQSSGAFCSASLVGEDLILTAGHCITSQIDCENTRFIFGFNISQKGGTTPSSVPLSDAYGCKKLVVRKQDNVGADYAVIQLDRKVTKVKPLELNRNGAITKGTSILVIGHPSGLPTKVDDNAIVRDTSKPGFFLANLDTYAGNSGSAVFNAQTGLIEGVLVRGEIDFVTENGCAVSNRCTSTGCRGEDVTRVSEVTSFIPQL